MTAAKKGHFQAVDLDVLVELKATLFGSASKPLPQGWSGQALGFSDSLPYGLVQKSGGPCGALAALQAHLLKGFLFPTGPRRQQQRGAPTMELSSDGGGGDLEAMNDPVVRKRALSKAIAHVIGQSSSTGFAWVLLPKAGGAPAGPGAPPGFVPGKFGPDGLTERLVKLELECGEELEVFVENNVDFFTADGNSAVVALLYSVILTRGPDQVVRDMDVAGSLVGAHGYCTQEMVNLLLGGKAVSNVFDGDVFLDGMALRGVSDRSDIGFLSLFEHYKSCRVGERLKTPRYPVWVICSESHFTVAFSQTLGAEEVGFAQRHPVHLTYYDQLANQDKPIVLTIDCSATAAPMRSGLVSPIELCLRTKWDGAAIDWNGSEPLL